MAVARVAASQQAKIRAEQRARETIATGLKRCPRKKCRRQNPQPIDNFNLEADRADGRQPYCKTCRRDIHITSTYGIEPSLFDAMLVDQGNRCACCDRDFNAARRAMIDHCHDTGVVRALLCNDCNTTLGRFADQQSLLRRLCEYALRHRQLDLAL